MYEEFYAYLIKIHTFFLQINIAIVSTLFYKGNVTLIAGSKIFSEFIHTATKVKVFSGLDLSLSILTEETA